MKKVVPFTKTITFKTMISEITDIEVSHTLKLNENYELEGDIIVDGKYKIHEASTTLEDFNYKLPFLISVDKKYDLSNLEIIISDFYFEIINEEDLKINVEIDLDNLELLEDVRNNEDLDNIIEIPVEIEEENKKLEVEDNDILNFNYELEDSPKVEVEKQETKEKYVNSIFSNLTMTEETFSTYHVYIVNENDTIEYILDKYNISKEELQNYNDLTDIKKGSKLIIPCNHE